MLFDDFKRTSSGRTRNGTNDLPPESGEALFPFLNEAAGEPWQRVRDTLTDWLAHYPAEDQPALVARFRRTDRRGFLGAFWELYLHELFRRLDFQIELHPRVAATSHRPDFRLSRGTTVTYVEAVTIYERPAYSIDDTRLAPLAEAVDRVSSPRYLVSLDVRQIASAALPLERLSRELMSWLDGLETETVARPARTSDRVFRWQEHGWMLLFRPVPREAEATPTADECNLGSDSIHSNPAADARTIRNHLSGKSRVYGRQFGEPFLIALTSYRPSYGPEALLQALFGPAWEHPAMMRAGVIRRSRSASSNGLWLTNRGVQYQDVSAVLTAFDVMPWSIARSQPWHVVNPWARHPLEIVLPFNRFNVDTTTGEIDRVETGFAPRVLFGLPSD